MKITSKKQQDFVNVAGSRLKKLRISKGVTLSDVSRKMNHSVSSKDISLFERGLRDIAALDLFIICDVLNIPADLVFYGNDSAVKKFIDSYCR